MRRNRVKASPDALESFYYCKSESVAGKFLFGEGEKEYFADLLRKYEEFSGVQVVAYVTESDHFHVLVRVPRRPAEADLPPDDELVRLVDLIDGVWDSRKLSAELKRLRASGSHDQARCLRETFFRRMWDVSAFMKSVKQRFAQWFNKRHGRSGVLWIGHFAADQLAGEDAFREFWLRVWAWQSRQRANSACFPVLEKKQ